MFRTELLREALEERQQRMKRLDADKGRKAAVRPVRARERLRKDPALAEAVARVREMLDSVPDVRAERVQGLKKGLQDGSLTRDSKAIAEKLLQETILDELL